MTEQRNIWILVLLVIAGVFVTFRGCEGMTSHPVGVTWRGAWQVAPNVTPADPWTVPNVRIPMMQTSVAEEEEDIDEDESGRGKKPFKFKKKYKKFMLPLLLAYKLKFFALIPVMIGGLLLLTGATGLAGFFFALFAATMGLNKGH